MQYWYVHCIYFTLFNTKRKKLSATCNPNRLRSRSACLLEVLPPSGSLVLGKNIELKRSDA